MSPATPTYLDPVSTCLFDAAVQGRPRTDITSAVIVYLLLLQLSKSAVHGQQPEG